MGREGLGHGSSLRGDESVGIESMTEMCANFGPVFFVKLLRSQHVIVCLHATKDLQLAEASGEKPGCEWPKTKLSVFLKSPTVRFMSLCSIDPKAKIRSTALCRWSSKVRRPSDRTLLCATLCSSLGWQAAVAIVAMECFSQLRPTFSEYHHSDVVVQLSSLAPR